jgi:hypothetical protein
MKHSLGFELRWGLVLGVFLTISSTSCSFTNSTEKSADFTSSTTPSSWYYPGELQNQRKVIYFSRANFGRLKEDMASGHGKYLTSLATLMQVPKDHHQDFFMLTKINFHDLFPTEHVTPEEMLLSLSKTLSSTPHNDIQFPLNNG